MRIKRLAVLLACVLVSSFMAGCGGAEVDTVSERSEETSAGASKQDTSTLEVSWTEDSTPKVVKTGSDVIKDVGGTAVYSTGSRLLFFEGNNLSFAEVVDGVQRQEKPAEDKSPQEFVFRMKNNVLSGTDAYGTYTDHGAAFYHWDLNDLEVIQEQELYSAETVTEALKEQAEKNGLYAFLSQEWAEKYAAEIISSGDLIDGGDGCCYKIVHTESDTISKVVPLLFSIMRIAKDGSGIGFVDNIHAGTMTIHDGYIYYYDPGYRYDPMTNEYGVGRVMQKGNLCRAAMDGSDVQVLLKDLSPAYQSSGFAAADATVSRLKVINNELYYIDNSRQGDSHLYKMALEGGSAVQVTEDQCANYYYDTEEDMLYYFTGDNLTSWASRYLIRKDMRSGKETALFASTDPWLEDDCMTVYGSYLYFADGNRYTGVQRLQDVDEQPAAYSGQRWNLRTGEMERLYCTVAAEDDTAENPRIRWETVTSSERRDELPFYQM